MEERKVIRKSIGNNKKGGRVMEVTYSKLIGELRMCILVKVIRCVKDSDVELAERYAQVLKIMVGEYNG
jgi:hypothetical protein